MRLALVNQFYTPDLSATAHLAASLAEHRAAKGDQVTVVTSQGGYVPGSELAQPGRADNPRVIRIWTPRLGKATLLKRGADYGTFYAMAMARSAALSAQDVVIVMTTPPAIGWAGVAHQWLHRRAKLLLWNMDCYPELGEATGRLKPGGMISKVLRAANRGVFRRVDHLVCLDTAMVELLHRTYVPNGRTLDTTIIPNWEPAAMFPPGQTPPRWTESSKLDLDGQFVVLYLGNMGTGYAFDAVIEAATQMRDEPVRFLFVGGGAKWDEVAAAKADRDLQNIVMAGYVPKEQVPSVVAAADCAYITLDDRCAGMASPSKLHSNLAMGLPIIYTGPVKSNVDEAIERFGCGISLRQHQADEMVTFLRDMMHRPDHFDQLRRKARVAFDEAYCDRQTLVMFDELLERLQHV